MCEFLLRSFEEGSFGVREKGNGEDEIGMEGKLEFLEGLYRIEEEHAEKNEAFLSEFMKTFDFLDGQRGMEPFLTEDLLQLFHKGPAPPMGGVTPLDEMDKEKEPKELPDSVIGPDHRFYCTKCPKSFANKGDFNNHERVVHKGILIKCNYCQREFRSRSSLSIHKKRHRESREIAKPLKKSEMEVIGFDNRHYCMKCKPAKSFATVQYLRDHVRVVHQGFRFRCGHCQKEYRSRANLYRHKMKHR